MRSSVIERAFELARSGKFTTAKEIDHAIKREGYTHAEIATLGFRSLRRDLLKACREARSPQAQP